MSVCSQSFLTYQFLKVLASYGTSLQVFGKNSSGTSLQVLDASSEMTCHNKDVLSDLLTIERARSRDLKLLVLRS